MQCLCRTRCAWQTWERAGVTKEFDNWYDAYFFSTYKNRVKNYSYKGIVNYAAVKAFHTKCEERREYIQAIIKHDLRKEYIDLTGAEHILTI